MVKCNRFAGSSANVTAVKCNRYSKNGTDRRCSSTRLAVRAAEQSVSDSSSTTTDQPVVPPLNVDSLPNTARCNHGDRFGKDRIGSDDLIHTLAREVEHLGDLR